MVATIYSQLMHSCNLFTSFKNTPPTRTISAATF